MKTTQITLHALPDELLSLVREWLSRGEMYAAVVRIGPEFLVTEVRTTKQLQDEIFVGGVPSRICLSRGAFDVDAATLHEFMTTNKMECIVDIGVLGDKGLKESSIAMSAENPDAWRFWSKAAREIKGATKAGLWAVSPITGRETFSKNNRYTLGATKLVEAGGRLLPLSGWNVFQIDSTNVHG
jgi:hypothetical protein